MAGRGTDIQLGGNAEMRIEDEVDPKWSEDKREKAITKIREEVELEKEKVKEAGGLYIIGTERHESRRIDNQLRGRSGRQGDPGASMFFLSVEDDLMRIFAGQQLESLLANKRIGLEEGEALEHPWISKMLERAQSKVESMNFEARKNLLKFDDVMNGQRKEIYEERREIMTSDNLEEMIRDMRYDVIEDMVVRCIPEGSYADQWDIETLETEISRLLNMDLPVKDWAKEEGIADNEIIERIIDAADKKMAEKAANTGSEIWRQIEKSIVLQILDQHWKEHLLNLDHLRQGINLRAFGQKDPLNEYKTEAFAMFQEMLENMRETITQTLSIVEFNIDQERARLLMNAERKAAESQFQESRSDPALSSAHKDNNQSVEVQQFPKKLPFDKNNPATWGKVPRNSPCPCESGKKYKQCHGKIR